MDKNIEMVAHVINKLEEALYKKHFNSESGGFSGDVDFNVWADAAYLLLLNKLGLNQDVSSNVEYILSCKNTEGGWGVTSDPNSEVSFKNSVIAYHAIKDYMCKEERVKTENFFASYSGNEWVDPYTNLMIRNRGEKFFYPPLIVSSIPESVTKIIGSLHMMFPSIFKWSIFLFPSGWSRNAFPQLSCGAYLLHKTKRSKRLKKMIDKVLNKQLENGSWFDTVLPTIGSIYALHLFGYSNESDCIKRGLRFLKNQVRKDGGINRFDLTVWNTSLSVTAITTLNKKRTKNMKLSIRFLINSQNKNGGWSFSENNIEMPDHDDTALALIALKDCRLGGYSIPTKTITQAIKFLIKKQNADGGWGAFDKNQCRKKAGYIPPWHIEYGHELKDPSTADVTSHVIIALCLYEKEYNLTRSIKRAVRFLEREQIKDGYWYGRWGLCYIYGTSRSIIALSMANLSCESLVLGIKWIKSVQNKDGGWGEKYLSYFNDSPILGESDIVLTSWCVIALLKYYKRITREILKGYNFIIDYLEEVDFNEITGSFTASAIEPAIYNIYYYIMPLQALNEYKKIDYVPN